MMALEIITDARTGEVTTREIPDPVPEVPASVTAMQARIALHDAGLLAAAHAAAEAAGGAVQIAWEYATEFPRNSPTLAALAAVIGLDDAAIDALFISAAQISA